jgi:hypothetical protein
LTNFRATEFSAEFKVNLGQAIKPGLGSNLLELNSRQRSLEYYLVLLAFAPENTVTKSISLDLSTDVLTSIFHVLRSESFTGVSDIIISEGALVIVRGRRDKMSP